MPILPARFSPLATPVASSGTGAPRIGATGTTVLLALTIAVITAVPGCAGARAGAPTDGARMTLTDRPVALAAMWEESPSPWPAAGREASVQPQDPPEQDGPEAPASPRTFLALWYGGNKQVAADAKIESPSAEFPGPVGVRLPEVETDPTVGGENERQWKAVTDVLLRRATASVDPAGAIALENGVAFLISETTEVKAGPMPEAVLYPIIVRTNQTVEIGTVGTDWLCYLYERPTTGGGTEEVLLVCLISAGNPTKGVWLRWNNQSATMETNMTFVKFVDGARSFWPPQAVNLNCDSTDQSPACLIGRVLKDTIQSAKAIGMIPESYSLPATP